MDTKYNGWTNRATWLFNLNFNNYEGLYIMLKQHIRRSWSSENLEGRLKNLFNDTLIICGEFNSDMAEMKRLKDEIDFEELAHVYWEEEAQEA